MRWGGLTLAQCAALLDACWFPVVPGLSYTQADIDLLAARGYVRKSPSRGWCATDAGIALGERLEDAGVSS